MPEPSHDREALVAEFCEEAIDLLHDLPERLTLAAGEVADADAIDLAFRAIHTVKGNAGFFGLPVIKAFAHSLEDQLDRIRGSQVRPDESLCRCLVEAVDALCAMVLEVQSRGEEAPGKPQHDELLERLRTLCAAADVESQEDRLWQEVAKLAEEMAACGLPQAVDWAERLDSLSGAACRRDDAADDGAGDVDPADGADAEAFRDTTFRCGDDDVTDHVRPLLHFFERLEGGEPLDRDLGKAFLDALDAWIRWAEGGGGAEGGVRSAGDIPSGNGDRGWLTEPLTAARQDFVTVFESPLGLDPFLLSVVWERLRPIFRKLQPGSRGEAARRNGPEALSGSAADGPGEGASAVTDPVAAGAKSPGKADPGRDRLIRVREEHVDEFLEDVSSLFITAERLKDLEHRMADELRNDSLLDELRQINVTLATQSSALQRSVVELRKVPARNLFGKFPRVARSLASELGKQLDVHLAGEELEIDKSLIDDLDGPLMHMIRNVCDHGIETPEERQARGLPPGGNLWLGCSLTKTHVVITVRDDGRGIDPERLRRKATERGLFTPEEAAQLGDGEATELIFHAGFSTAAEVSEISGRGVGLDVVRTRIREHGGDIRVTSAVGEGSEFRMEIPIRRAVVAVDALLVRHGQAKFVLPFEHIREITRVDRRSLSNVQGRPVARVRDETFAALPLEEVIRVSGSESREREQWTGVLVQGDAQSAVLLIVDAVLGQRKVVVNDLPPMVNRGHLLSGVAQLGAGELALVLNARDVGRVASRKRRPGPR